MKPWADMSDSGRLHLIEKGLARKMTYREIGARYGVSKNVVAGILHRARHRPRLEAPPRPSRELPAGWLDRLREEVARHYGLAPAVLLSRVKNLRAGVNRARRVYWYLAVTLIDDRSLSLRALGLDAKTARTAMRIVEDARDDPELDEWLTGVESAFAL